MASSWVAYARTSTSGNSPRRKFSWMVARCANRLARETFGRDVEVRPWVPRTWRGVVVFVGEIDHFRRSSVIDIEAMIASYFLAIRPGIMPSQSWITNSLEVRRLAQGVGDVDVEADQLALGIDRVERRIGALGADLDLALVLGVHAGREHGERRCGHQASGQSAHCQSSRLPPVARRPTAGLASAQEKRSGGVGGQPSYHTASRDDPTTARSFKSSRKYAAQRYARSSAAPPSGVSGCTRAAHQCGPGGQFLAGASGARKALGEQSEEAVRVDLVDHGGIRWMGRASRPVDHGAAKRVLAPGLDGHVTRAAAEQSGLEQVRDHARIVQGAPTRPRRVWS